MQEGGGEGFYWWERHPPRQSHRASAALPPSTLPQHVRTRSMRIVSSSASSGVACAVWPSCGRLMKDGTQAARFATQPSRAQGGQQQEQVVHIWQHSGACRPVSQRPISKSD